MDVDVRCVEFLEVGQGGVGQGVVRSVGCSCCQRLLKGLPHQVAYAVAHHATVLLQAVQGEAAYRQRVVYRRRQVFQGVQQRAVKVEDYEFVWGCHG